MIVLAIPLFLYGFYLSGWTISLSIVHETGHAIAALLIGEEVLKMYMSEIVVTGDNWFLRVSGHIGESAIFFGLYIIASKLSKMISFIRWFFLGASQGVFVYVVFFASWYGYIDDIQSPAHFIIILIGVAAIMIAGWIHVYLSLLKVEKKSIFRQ